MKLVVSLLLLLASTLAFSKDRSEHSLGIGAGTPWVASVMYEYWPTDFPLVVRAHAGTVVVASSGGLDIGISIDNDGDFRQYVGVSGEAAFTMTY